MRLCEGMKQTVTVKPAAAVSAYQANDRLYRFDDTRAFAVRAVLQPLAVSSGAKVYGDTPEAKLLMLFDGSELLTEGMGVCVDVSETEACDYRIAEMPRRYKGHKEFTLAFLPAEMRG